jgi:hypothetical protein
VSWPGFTRVSVDFVHDAAAAVVVVVVLEDPPPHPAAAVAMAVTTAAKAIKRNPGRALDPMTAASLSPVAGTEAEVFSPGD